MWRFVLIWIWRWDRWFIGRFRFRPSKKFLTSHQNWRMAGDGKIRSLESGREYYFNAAA
jgi:hypothetical protein